MPAIILGDEVTLRIKELNAAFKPFAEKGWMCEGSDDADGCLYSVLFNNDTDEWFRVDERGNIVAEDLSTTSMSDAKSMAVIQTNIRKTLEAL